MFLMARVQIKLPDALGSKTRGAGPGAQAGARLTPGFGSGRDRGAVGWARVRLCAQSKSACSSPSAPLPTGSSLSLCLSNA